MVTSVRVIELRRSDQSCFGQARMQAGRVNSWRRLINEPERANATELKATLAVSLITRLLLAVLLGASAVDCTAGAGCVGAPWPDGFGFATENW